MPNLFLLMILYTFQGLTFGLFLSTVPIVFKQYLNYNELGVVMLCTMPYSFKVFWSPLIELYSIPGFGKRKSWVVPSQLAICAVLVYL